MAASSSPRLVDPEAQAAKVNWRHIRRDAVLVLLPPLHRFAISRAVRVEADQTGLVVLQIFDDSCKPVHKTEVWLRLVCGAPANTAMWKDVRMKRPGGGKINPWDCRPWIARRDI